MQYLIFTLLVFHALDAFAQQSDSIPPGVQRLLDAYPDHLEGYQDNYIHWKDGTKMPVSYTHLTLPTNREV